MGRLVDILKVQIAAKYNVLPTNIFFCDPVNGSSTADGLNHTSALQDFLVTYNKLTTNLNDAMILIGGASANNLAAAFEWKNSYNHIVGMAPKLRFGGRVRIGHKGVPMSPMFKVSGSGNLFSNLHLQHGQQGASASATNLICAEISGLRNRFEDCHFEASLDTTASGGSYAWRCVQLDSGAQANEFHGCTFGSWTESWASTAGNLIRFVGDNADTYFKDCTFITNTSSTSMVPIAFTGPISGANSHVTFENCKFLNLGSAPAVIFGNQTNGKVELIDCRYTNATAWATTNAGLLLMNGTAQNAVAGGEAIAQS